MNLPKRGIYRHFKGKRYELLDLARHSETLEWMVVYRALYGEGGTWVRPLSMWFETVEHEGKTVQRFALESAFENEEITLFEVEEERTEIPAAVEIADQLSVDGLSPKFQVLKRFYGYDSFREGQEDVVDSILSGRDTLAVMPTGAGKSVCYQVPAMVMDGVALVISPLISLMKDQVQTLIQNGVPAAYLNSSLTERQFDLAMRNAVQGKYRIIYVAPERLLTPRFLSAMMGLKISMVAVDEAHCISQWGQDFRPSYLTIPDFLDRLPQRPTVCAFTATATQRVRDDIVSMLALQNPYVRITGFNRTNLYYSVSEPASKDTALVSLLKDYRGMSGIVYCATRKKVESVYELLLKNGFLATRYHAGLSDVEREANQEDFTYDRREIMVATNAFGMGIDKSNVRFVIHYNMPKDLESYYQEAGRAGRDGERSDCHLLFGRQDIITQQFFIDKIGEEAGLEGEALQRVQDNARDRLQSMIRYCQTPGCLRKYILNYFGEVSADRCDFCFNCLTPSQMEDVTASAQAILRCVDQTHERFGRNVIIDILRGAETERIRQFRLDNLLSYGALRNVTRDVVSSILDRLIEVNALRQEMVELPSGQYPILKLGDRADDVLDDILKIEIIIRTKKKGSKRNRDDVPENIDRDLFERLKALRKKIALSRGVPPFVVFNDKVLRALADQQPRSMAEMEKISGIGVVKLREFGQRFLKEILAYLEENKTKED